MPESLRWMPDMKSLPKLVIFGDPKKGPVAEAIKEFAAFAEGKARITATYSIENLQNGADDLSGQQHKGPRKAPPPEPMPANPEILKKCDFAIVFGGDGSIISTARYLSQANLPVIGVNLGKLGFLAEFSVAELKECFEDIISGIAPIGKRMMLDCRVLRNGKEELNSTAVNEVFITAGPPFGMIELKISVDGQPLAGCVSDGLIISTPTGSTAYNLSAGGPIVSPKMEAMVITPICPHSLSFRPIVINANCTVEVFGVKVNKGTTVSVDGHVSAKLSDHSVVTVQRRKGDFLIVNNPRRSRWDTLATKLSWAEKPKYKRDSAIRDPQM